VVKIYKVTIEVTVTRQRKNVTSLSIRYRKKVTVTAL